MLKNSINYADIAGFRFNNITFARLLAALFVYLHHASEAVFQSITFQPLLYFFRNGYVGVSFFFIVSGFVLSASNLKNLERFSAAKIAVFYYRRFIRIAPLWLFVSAPLIISAYRTGNPALWSYLTFTQAWNPDIAIAYGLLAVSWTLSVEMFFYAVFPFIAMALSAIRSASLGPWIIVAGLLPSIAGTLYFWIHPEQIAYAHFWLYRFPGSRIGEFILGSGIYLTIVRTRIACNVNSALSLLATSAVASAALMTTFPYQDIRVFQFVPAMGLLIFAMARLDRIGLSIQNKLLLLLGESSFALYLIHQHYNIVLR